MTLPTGPYVGLIPYREEDAAFFFGREAELEIISANLMASRLTLLYGPSGVGKTSVLHAGVAHHLGQQATKNVAPGGRPEYAVVVFGSWRDEPVPELLTRVNEEVVRSLGRPVDTPAPTRSLASGLEAWTERLGGDLLIILDQFEEYFVYHEGEEGEGTLAGELPAAVTQPDLRVNILISIREDALARLDQFKGSIPNLFANYLRIEHLDIDAARRAIELPLEEFNRVRVNEESRGIRIEPALVEAVLEQVQAGQVLAPQGGLGIAGGTSEGPAGKVRIEAPYLQLVMSRLWEEEMVVDSRLLRLGTLARLGGAERIVRTHLDQALSTLPTGQQAIAAKAFRYLVTPSGSKITHTTPDLAEYAGVTTAELSPLLRSLADPTVRVLRPVAPPPTQPETPRYEIFHDVLAAPILDWRTRYENAETARRLELDKAEAQRDAARERRRARKFRSLSLALVLVTLLTFIATAVALRERGRANMQLDEARHEYANALHQKKRAKSQAFRARAAATNPIDPLVGLVLAVEAWKVSPEANAGDILAQSLARMGAADAGGGETLPEAVFSPDGSRVVTIDMRGTVSVWDAGNGEQTATIESGERVSSVAFSPDGDILATADLSGEARTWDASNGELIRSLISGGLPLRDISFGEDGQRLITTGPAQGETIWNIRRPKPLLVGITDPPVVSSSFAWISNLTLSLDSKGEVWLNVIGPGTSVSGGPLLSRQLSNAYGMALSADRRMTVTMNADNLGGVWRLLVRRIPRIGFRNGEIVTLPGHDQEATAKLVATLRGHTSPMTAAAFSPDASLVVTSSVDGTARIWDSATGETLRVLRGNDGPMLDAAFDAEGKLVVTAGSFGRTRLWEVSTGRLVRVLQGRTDETVISASFSPDGSQILTDTVNGLAEVWNTGTGQVEFTFDS